MPEQQPSHESFTRQQELGFVACSETLQILNDPSAHLFLLQSRGKSAWPQIKLEFRTDQVERNSPESKDSKQGFHETFYFLIEPNFELRSMDSGQGMHNIHHKSVEAAQALGINYGIAREQARATEPLQLVDWLQEGGKGYALKTSMCPSTNELDEFTARRLNFRQQSLMSVNSIYSVENGMLRADFYSLNGHDREMQQNILDLLGINRTARPTSLEELTCLDVFDIDTDPVGVIKDRLGQCEYMKLDREKLAEAEAVYIKMLTLCLESEAAKITLVNLIRECRELGISFPVGRFSRNDSRRILEHLRKTSLPHHIFGAKKSASSDASGGENAVYTSSKEATAMGVSYENMCPGAYSGPQEQSALGGGYMNVLQMAANKTSLLHELRSTFKGFGPCLSCSPAETKPLYGCGVFCRECNDVWCSEWSSNGRQLTPKQVRFRRVVTPKKRANKAQPQKPTSWFSFSA